MNITQDTMTHAQDILDFIIMNPERHDQDSWVEDIDNFCGTTMCAAGTSVFLKEGVEGLYATANFSNHVYFDDKACANLGLSLGEGNSLFYSNNDQAIAMLTAIAQGDQVKFDSLREVV